MSIILNKKDLKDSKQENVEKKSPKEKVNVPKSRKHVPWRELKLKHENIAFSKGKEFLEKEFELITIDYDESKKIECETCSLPLYSNHCYVNHPTKQFYCWKCGDNIQTYYKQIHNLDNPDELRRIFTMRRYSMPENRIAKWKIEATLDVFYEKCTDCVFQRTYLQDDTYDTKIQVCTAKIKLLETDFEIKDPYLPIMTSVNYYCRDKHAEEWKKEMLKSKDDIISIEKNVITRQESKILEAGDTFSQLKKFFSV